VLIRRLMREAKATQEVRHPNIITIYEVAVAEDGEPVVVMELLEGESLHACLQRKGALPVPLAAGILARVLSGVRAAHAAGIVHRDLKPENIFLVDQPDGTFEVRILDFGIAKRVGAQHELSRTENLTVTGTVVGTPYYMAPEQAFGEKDLDRQVDVWAMGVIVFECLTAQFPVVGDNIGQLMKALFSGSVAKLSVAAPAVPKDLMDAVDHALTPDRARRAPDLVELEEVIMRHAGPLAIAALERGIAPRRAVRARDADELPDVLGSTQLASERPPSLESVGSLPGAMQTTVAGSATRARRSWRPRALVAAVLLAVAGPTAWLASRPRSVPDASRAPHSATPLTPAELAGAAASGAPVSLTAGGGASSASSSAASASAAVASAASAAVASASAVASGTKRPAGRGPAASANRGPSASPPAIKLQGGVAAETPF
jgi:serine/threonine-protein kinase